MAPEAGAYSKIANRPIVTLRSESFGRFTPGPPCEAIGSLPRRYVVRGGPLEVTTAQDARRRRGARGRFSAAPAC